MTNSGLGDQCPRVLINLEKAGEASDLSSIMHGGGMMFDKPGNYRDVAILGTCDDGCHSLVEILEFGQDSNIWSDSEIWLLF